MDRTTYALMKKLTPGDRGTIAGILDDCMPLSDDCTCDLLGRELFWEAGIAPADAKRIAYHVVHARRRQI